MDVRPRPHRRTHIPSRYTADNSSVPVLRRALQGIETASDEELFQDDEEDPVLSQPATVPDQEFLRDRRLQTLAEHMEEDLMEKLRARQAKCKLQCVLYAG
jgi:hypothetical protein